MPLALFGSSPVGIFPERIGADMCLATLRDLVQALTLLIPMVARKSYWQNMEKASGSRKITSIT